MSLRTCSWLFPQKEQRYGTLGPFELLVVVTRSSSLPASGGYSLAFFVAASWTASAAEPSPPASPASWAWAIRESPGSE